MTPIHEYIYSVLYIWKYICGIHTYTQHIKFCSHNQIIYPRRDSTWIQSTYKHNLFSTARVTYTMDSSVGTGEGYSQGYLMNLLLREVRITKNVSWQSQHSAILHHTYSVNISCHVWSTEVWFIFCVVLSLAFKAECVVYMKSERIFSFLWWKVRWSIYINHIKCEFATKMIEDFDRAH